MLLLIVIGGVDDFLLSIIIDDVDYRLGLFLACITGSLIICSIVTVAIDIVIVVGGVLILTQIITINISIGSINISIVTNSITSTTTTTSQIHPLTIIFIIVIVKSL